MIDAEIIKTLEECLQKCQTIKYGARKSVFVQSDLLQNALDLINRQKAENDNLYFTLHGVMHFVDKWLDGDELNKDEVNRAIAMRDKTLEITERQAEQIEALISGQETLQRHIAEKEKEIDKLTVNKNAFAMGMVREKERADIAEAEAKKEFAEKFNAILAAFDAYDTLHIYEIKDRIDIVEEEMVGETDV